MQVSKSRDISVITAQRRLRAVLRPTYSLNFYVNLCRPFPTSRGRLDTAIGHEQAVNP